MATDLGGFRADDWAALWAHGPEALILHEAGGAIVDVNARMLELFAVPDRAAAQRLSLLADLSADAEAARQLAAALARPEQPFEWSAKSLAGAPLTLAVQWVCQPGASARYLALLRDETARRQWEAERQELEQALQQALERAQAAEAELQRLANVDALTGLSNRPHFQAICEMEIQRALRYGRPLALILLDIDNFRHLGDRYGSAVGDEVLVHLGQLLRRNVRLADVVARMGEDEFGVLLPETHLNDAARLAERLRTLIAESVFPASAEIVLCFSCSLGVAELRWPSDTYPRLSEAAEAALGQAKQNGSNRVEVEPPEEEA